MTGILATNSATKHKQFTVTKLITGKCRVSVYPQYEYEASRAVTRIADEYASAPVLYCVFSSKPYPASQVYSKPSTFLKTTANNYFPLLPYVVKS